MYLVNSGEKSYNNIKIYENCIQMCLQPLTTTGIKQAKELLEDDRLQTGIIISSPYTCALQTSYILADGKRDVTVEKMLHDWLPDKMFNASIQEMSTINQEYTKNNGLCVNDKYNYETKDEMRARILLVIEKYKEMYNTDDLILVCHDKLIKAFTEYKKVKNCEVFNLV